MTTLLPQALAPTMGLRQHCLTHASVQLTSPTSTLLPSIEPDRARPASNRLVAHSRVCSTFCPFNHSRSMNPPPGVRRTPPNWPACRSVPAKTPGPAPGASPLP